VQSFVVTTAPAVPGAKALACVEKWMLKRVQHDEERGRTARLKFANELPRRAALLDYVQTAADGVVAAKGEMR
jgi:hypothetical protein